MKTIRFGLIGCGLMGREFASATARWCHLPKAPARPELVAICARKLSALGWFRDNFPGLKQITDDYQALLANPDVDAVYIALPHHLHRATYCAAIQAGKHLLGEKPFGMDQPDCDAIVTCARAHPDVFVRCSSQFPFYPGVQRIGRMIERAEFGRILEVQTGFLHSSDLDPQKPINWKRQIEFNGEYGVMGDLGMHACHVVFRAGWRPQNVRAILSDIIHERPDGQGGRTSCSTWDNATLLCEATDADGQSFPWTLRTCRIAPGQKNNWYVEISGTKAGARWRSTRADMLELLRYEGGEQVWGQMQLGHETAYQSITGAIFQFGFSDAILQMWAAFLSELAGVPPRAKFASCAKIEEAQLSHRLFTAALASQQHHAVIPI